MTTSFAPQVRTGSDPKFYGNALRFETKEEAQGNVDHLAGRWLAVTETRVVETDDPITHVWESPGNRAAARDLRRPFPLKA
jgi:hypothetical protein